MLLLPLLLLLLVPYIGALGALNDRHYSVELGHCSGDFFPRENETGWNELQVRCRGSGAWAAAADFEWDQALDAGRVEGHLTAELIILYLENFNLNFAPFWKQFPALKTRLNAWVETWWAWVNAEAEQRAQHDPYWRQVRLMIAQLKGLSMGVNARRKSGETLVTEFDLLVLNSGADTMELVQYWTENASSSLSDHYRDAQDAYTQSIKRGLAFGRTHCSSLVRFDAQTLAVEVGHTTWGQYLSMLRIMKTFDVQWDVSRPRESIIFSSYPGFLFSGDDFLAKRKSPHAAPSLVVVETTLSVYNKSLLSRLHPKGVVLTWMRGMVAMRSAETAEDWTAAFARYSSGTYTNAWSVVGIQRGLSTRIMPELWLLEEMPGIVSSGNLTDLLLEQGYLPSYNIPYFKDIFEIGGYAEMEQKFGDLFSYSECPRAKQFRQFHGKTPRAPMTRIMQYNDYQNDPTSLGSPTHAISSRFDLAPQNSSDFMGLGGIDSKIITLGAGKNPVFASCGPTHQEQPVFEWSKTPLDGQVFHLGQPNRFNFEFVQIPF